MAGNGADQQRINAVLARVLFAALVVIASLNRETGVYLAVIWFLLARNWQDRALGVLYGLIGAMVLLALRMVYGSPAATNSIEALFLLNTTRVSHWIPIALFCAALVAPALLSAWRCVSARRMIPLAVFALGMFAVFAIWREVRVLWTLSGIWLLMSFVVQGRRAI